MMVPLEIEDEEYEQVLERVAAVDVAKATGMVHPGAVSVPAGQTAVPGCGRWTRIPAR